MKKKAGLVFNAHRRLYHSTPGFRVIMRKGGAQGLDSRAARFGEMMERIEMEATAAVPAQGILRPSTQNPKPQTQNPKPET